MAMGTVTKISKFGTMNGLSEYVIITIMIASKKGKYTTLFKYISPTAMQ
jgi:hypothetical protein